MVVLKVPKPELINQAAVLAPPPKPAPLKVIAVGEADSQASIGSPASTVNTGSTVIVRVSLTGEHPAVASLVNSRVIVPFQFA